MYQLDSVGRLAPSSLDVSRAAARRHAHTSALRDDTTPFVPSPVRRLRMLVGRAWSADPATSPAPSRPLQRPHLDHAVRDSAGCA